MLFARHGNVRMQALLMKRLALVQSKRTTSLFCARSLVSFRPTHTSGKLCFLVKSGPSVEATGNRRKLHVSFTSYQEVRGKLHPSEDKEGRKHKKKTRNMGLCSIRGFLIVGGVIALALSFHLYTPIQDGAEDPWLLRTYIASRKIFYLISGAASYIPSVNQNDVIRALFEFYFFDNYVQSDPVLEVLDAKFEGIPVKIFRPKAARTSSPAIIYMHGGGWTMLSATAYSTVTAHMARTYNVIVVSVDYRLAPEHPYPLPFDDCLKATRHVLQNGQNYGINPKRVAVAGDSAGGNLAAAVALRLADEDRTQTPPLKFQVLIYPALQAFDFNTYSYQAFASTGFLEKNMMVEMWMNYMGFPELRERSADFAASNHTSPMLKKSEYAAYIKHENLPKEYQSSGFKPVSDKVGNTAISSKIEATLLDPYFAPLMASDLSKVPPAYIIVAENDPLRDDGLLYAERLKNVKVPVHVDYYQKSSHAFCVLGPIDMFNFHAGIRAFDALGKYVKDNL